jgi:hypothetical protein
MKALLLLLAAVPAFGYTVGGNISGLNNNLVLRLNNTYTKILLSSATQYLFTEQLPANSIYFVSVGIQPAGQKCTMTNGLGKSIVNVTANITCIQVTSTTLTWTQPTLNTDGSALTDLTGYVIYWGTDSTFTTKSTRIISNKDILTTRISNLLLGKTYYFAVASISASGGIGQRSNAAQLTT